MTKLTGTQSVFLFANFIIYDNTLVMKLPKKTLERRLFDSGYGYICAVDEVGMGCLAGPVVVCAVGITNQFYKKHHKKLVCLRESKLLLPHQREVFAGKLMAEKGLVYALALCQ